MNRTFVVYVEDKPGVMNRVSSLFRARAYNIESINSGRTHTEGVHRMTIVVKATADQAKRIEANLYKCVNVLQVADITDHPSVTRILALIKVRATPETRTAVIQLGQVFRARVVDVGPDALVFEITGGSAKIESLIETMKPYGIIEDVRTGCASMTRASDESDDPLAFDIDDLFAA
jgi:acetolactate synthase-1/3 small subunit